MFKIGRIYNRQLDLHNIFGGNRQSGISVCASHPMIFLFTSPRGEKFGYRDEWISDTQFRYSGEGQYGNMEMTRGNLAIRGHAKNGVKLLLFKKVGDGDYEFLGEMRYLSHRSETSVDVDGRDRTALVFILERVENYET